MLNPASKKFPIVLSIAIMVALALWMASGLFQQSESSTTTSSAATANTALQQVRVQVLQAEAITREVVVSASTAANRNIEVRSEAEGIVTKLGSERGALVQANAVLASIDLRDRPARLNEAKALLAQRDLEFSSITNLHGRKFTTDVQVAEAKARLESAKASVARIELELANTTIKAPFDAVLQERDIEVGDFVRVGDRVGELVDLDPLIVRGEVNERDVSTVNMGNQGVAVLMDGTRLQGQLRYLAPQADSGTRTFQVELEVANPDNKIRAGLTAELRLMAETVRVHHISAALLTLADDGTVGAKVVDERNTVRFYPVEIVGNTERGMQVSGLPDSVRLITVGQGFVVEGQQVNPVTVAAE